MDAHFAGIPERLWRRIAPLIPARQNRTRRGRPPVPDRAVMAGILYRLRTGCQWKALPAEFGSGSTCHLRLQRSTKGGVFAAIFTELLRYYDRRRGILWKWSSLDSAMPQGTKRGQHTGKNPTDRAKLGVKRHILTDARGVPLAAIITGANVHDKWMVGQTLDAIALRGPRGPRRPQHLCLDKGYAV